MKPFAFTLIQNIGACVILALFLHSPDLSLKTFSQSWTWRIAYGIPYWLSVPIFIFLAYRLNWRTEPANLPDRIARIVFTMFLPLFAIWYFLYIGWFIGHRL